MNVRKNTIISWGGVFALILGAGSTGAHGRGDLPCSHCGPFHGSDWIGECNAGEDIISHHGALVGLDFDGNCEANPSWSFALHQCPDTSLTISRSAPYDADGNGDPDTIDTEIVEMCLSGVEGMTLTAGSGLGLDPSPGTIVEQLDQVLADSRYHVRFKVNVGGTFSELYNNWDDPMLVETDIDCIPPKAEYIHPDGCRPLYLVPYPDPGEEPVAWLVNPNHLTYEIPALSVWGIVVMALLMLTVGTIVYGRRPARRPAVE